MRILVLSFYYPPDLSAGSYRASALVEALLRSTLSDDLELEVLTTQPNRYSSYSGRVRAGAALSDVGDRLLVRRLPVSLHRSGIADQCLAFCGFAARALLATRGRRYDVVVATTSRLFTGALGALIARRSGANLYLDVRDLFVDSLTDLFPGNLPVRLMKPILSRVERFTVQRANRINVVSPAFCEYFSVRYPAVDVSVHTNGVDAEFLEFDYTKAQSGGERVILYAGNLGYGQNLEQIVPLAASVLGDAYRFRIIGDGSRRKALLDRIKAMKLSNVDWSPPMDRGALRHEYREADCLLMHLSDAPAMHKVLPSKTFEYASTGKPLLAGVAGFAREYVERHVSNAVVFEPGDVDGLVEALRHLDFRPSDRRAFVDQHSRRRIMDDMAREILGIGRRIPFDRRHSASGPESDEI